MNSLYIFIYLIFFWYSQMLKVESNLIPKQKNIFFSNINIRCLIQIFIQYLLLE